MKKWLLPLLIFSLGLMGLVTLSSVSPELMQRQLLFFVFSFVLFWFAAQLPIQQWWQWGEWLWKGLVILLLGLLIFGRATRGSMAWIDLGWGLRFQPSQFALLIFALFALPQFSKTQVLKDTQIAKLLWLFATPLLLILLQPDFGTGFLYAISALPLLLWQKIPKQYWRGFWLAAVVLLVVGWTMILKPYQKLRLTSFMSGSQADQSGAGYNARQALIAVGAGQFTGRGLGHGTQSQLRFLPERQTDFIFASLAEEWGLLGSLVVIALYATLISFLLYQAKFVSETDQALFLLITAVHFLAQILVNIGMNIGLLPITGITLPLISYGGSSLLATLILLGIAQRIIVLSKGKSHLHIS
ncbi:MAG: FtsW/RodA/SpoVE family cell cycle protein [Candidatus Paceibacterota bacterium]